MTYHLQQLQKFWTNNVWQAPRICRMLLKIRQCLTEHGLAGVFKSRDANCFLWGHVMCPTTNKSPVGDCRLCLQYVGKWDTWPMNWNRHRLQSRDLVIPLFWVIFRWFFVKTMHIYDCFSHNRQYTATIFSGHHDHFSCSQPTPRTTKYPWI